MAAYDAVFVGSGINTLTGAALLSREGWSVCVLERDDAPRRCDPDGRRTTPCPASPTRCSAPGIRSSGVGRLRRARGRPPRARARVRQHRPADGDGVPRRRGDVPADVAGGERRRVRPPRTPATARRGQPSSTTFMANADLSFGVLGTELWSVAGLSPRPADAASLRTSRPPRLRRRQRSPSCRDWTDRDLPAERAHGLLAPWVLHTGLGPDSAVSGFMTQVIACAVQLGGMPVPVGGGVRLVDALAGIVRDAGGELGTSAERRRGSLVSLGAGPPASSSPTARRFTRRARSSPA